MPARAACGAAGSGAADLPAVGELAGLPRIVGAGERVVAGSLGPGVLLTGLFTNFLVVLRPRSLLGLCVAALCHVLRALAGLVDVTRFAVGLLGTLEGLRVVAQIAGRSLGVLTCLLIVCRRCDSPLGQAFPCARALLRLGRVEAAHGLALLATGKPAVVLLAAAGIAIGHAVAVGRVMAPGGAIAVDGAVAVEVAVDVDVPVAVEVVVMLHVDVDLVVVPVAVAPERADDGDASAKCQAGRQCSGYRVFGRRRVVDRWARRIGPGAVDLRRVVAGDVDHLRIGRLDDDGLRRRRLLHNRGTTAGRGLSGSRRRRFDGDGLLLIRLQVAGGLGLATQALDGVHHRIRLGQEGIADPLYPDRVLSQRRQYQWEGNQRLDAGVPWLICHLLYGVVATDFGVRLRPCCRVGHIAG